MLPKKLITLRLTKRLKSDKYTRQFFSDLVRPFVDKFIQITI